jgi:ryanodine receptor 2
LFRFNQLIASFFSEKEKMRRWEEIRLRQHRLMAEAEHTTPAHIDHIMKSGFTINDIKGLNRNYDEAGESDEVLRPNRPPRRTSITRNGNYGDTLEVNGRMQRSTSELDMNNYENDERDDKKKRGRSPFRLFGKKRDQSKEKIKGKGGDNDRTLQGRNVIQSTVMTRNPTVRVSNVRRERFLDIHLMKRFYLRLI